MTNPPLLQPTVIGAFVSHVMHVDPYRWPAWFMAGVTAVFMIIFLATFKETEKFHCSKCRTFNLQFSTSESETGKKNYSAILVSCNFSHFRPHLLA